jgi:hypothetical protein
MLSPASQAQSEGFKRAHRENNKLLSFQSTELADFRGDLMSD